MQFLKKVSILFSAIFELIRLICVSFYFYSSYKLVSFFTAKDKTNELKGIYIRKYLLIMGPLYIKGGQVFATQSGSISRETTNQLRSFFSDVPPSSTSYIQSKLKHVYNDSFDSKFDNFNITPIAVGTVAQVHQAFLKNGQKVAIKIVKDGVRKQLEISVFLLEKLLNVMHKISPALRKYDLAERFREVRPLLIEQCDMLSEIVKQNEVSQNFKNHPYLIVPKTYNELSNKDILVMEFIEGIRGQDSHLVNFPKEKLAQRLQDIFYTMTYFHGVFHLDPHPGNIFFKEDGKIVLLDFGLIGYLTEDDKWSVSAFYYACSRQEWDLAIQRFTDAFIVTVDDSLQKNKEEYTNIQREVLKKHFDYNKESWSTMMFFEDTSKVLNDYNARITIKFTLLSIALLTGEGFIVEVDPKIDIWKNARKFTDTSSPYMSPSLKVNFDLFFSQLLQKSLAERVNANDYLIAPTHLDRYVFPSTFPLIVKNASGSKITDIDDNTYIDLACGYGPHILGHAHPAIIKAIQSSIQNGCINAMGSLPELELAKKISKAFNNSKVIFSNSGTESVIMAIRLARAYTGKNKVGKCEGHYHGFSDQGMVSSWFRFKGSKNYPEPFQGTPGTQSSVVSETVVFQYGKKSAYEIIKNNHKDLACIILEPMPSSSAEGNVLFLKDIRTLCDEFNIVLIFDEVVTGFRVCYGGAQHLIGVVPDLTCLGKIIGGGLPCGAVVGNSKIMDIAKTSMDPFIDISQKAFVGGTLSGNSVTCSAGLAALTYLEKNPKVYDDLEIKTKWLNDELVKVAKCKGVPHNINGNRSIFSITFDNCKPELFRDRLSGSNFKANVALSYYMRKHHVYVPELHTMMLSDAHDMEDLKKIVVAFDKSMDEMLEDNFFTL